MSGLLISLLSWPSFGEAMARLCVFQSPGSSCGCVQFTFWTVKCNRLAGEHLRFGYEEEMLHPSMSERRCVCMRAREWGGGGGQSLFFYLISSSSSSSWLTTAGAGKPRPTCTQPAPSAPLGFPTLTGIPPVCSGSSLFSVGCA